MLSPSDEVIESNGDTSSVTLPLNSNGWESTSSEETEPSSKSSQDELIGSPRASATQSDGTESQSDNCDFDQDTVISFNSENEQTSNENNKNASLSTPSNALNIDTLEVKYSCSETSDAESEALSVQSKVELESLKKIVKKLKRELETEKDTVILLRKKLTQTNRDKLGQTSQFNDEMSLLKYENVALQARLEEQTVHTEQLEYELTKARKKHQQDQSFAEQREAQDTKEIQDLKNRLAEAQGKLSMLEENYKTMKRENAEETHKLKLELESKGSKLTSAEKAIEITKTENVKLTEFIKEQERTLKEMLEKIQSTEAELSSVKRELSETKDELANQTELSTEQAALLLEIQAKCETLAVQLDEERSRSGNNEQTINSLESKSVQLECALNDEKAVSGELRHSSEHMRKQLHELEENHSRQTREFGEAVHSLTRSEQELANLKKQVLMEKEDKRDLVNKLKKQLDVHQEHVNTLRAELSATNKHQKYMEEISQKIVNDLQPVFNGFPTETGETTATISSSSLKNASEDWTRSVFDTLHNSVSRYKKRLTSLAEEKMKAKAQCDSLTKESASYKEMLYEKEKAYEDCRSKLTNAVKEMDRVSRDSTEVEARCATMTVDVETAKSHNETLQAQCRSLNHEMLQMKGKYDKDSDEKQIYLQRIYHLLTSDLDLASSFQGQLSDKDKFTWNELCTTVSERLSAVLNELVHLRQKVCRLDETVVKSESYADSLREEHSTQIENINQQLAATIERNSTQWKEERARLEDHYSNMMSENLNRQQIYKEQLEKSQRNADEAWDKLRDSDETNRTLESEKLDINEKITLLEQRQRSLLCALALITGSYFPLLRRNGELKEQRSMLMNQVNRFSSFKHQVSSLLQTLALEMPASPASTPRGSACARLRFRKAVLVVLAVHRLRKACGRSTISIRDEGRQCSLLCWTTSDCNVEDREMAAAEGHLVQWLCHIDLESVANMCTKETIETLDRWKDGSVERGYLKSVVSSALSKMVRQLSVLYRMDDVAMRTPHKYSYNTLAVKLMSGLQNSMFAIRAVDHLAVIPAHSVATTLQEKLLNFIQQLHISESERKRLREKMDSLNEAMEQLGQYQEACSDLEQELHGARRQMEKLVPMAKMEDVNLQLEQAMERDSQAQTLLTEQNAQLKELTRRLELESNDRDHSEQSAKFALKTLHDELDSKQTSVNNLTRQVSTLEGERQSLHDNIYDAEHALKTAAHDRQTLSNYVETLTAAFNKCGMDEGQADMSRVMLSGELIPSGRPTPSLLAVQRLVQEFVEAHTSLQVKISALNAVTTEQLQEITRLKQQMSVVCTGQMDYAQRSNQVYQYPSSGYGSSLSPLKVTSDHSSFRHSPAVIDIGLVTKAKPHSPLRSNPSHYHYPVTSSPPRPINMSPRLSSSRGTPSPRLEMNGNIRR